MKKPEPQRVAILADWGRAARDMAAAGWSAMRARSIAPPTAGTCPPVPVVMLPGVLEPWRYLLPIGNWLAGQGHPVYYVRGLGFNMGDLPASAQQVGELVETEGLRNAVFFAHSKGGLIGKLALLNPLVTDRVLGMVALSTPFSGARLAQRFRWFVSRTSWNMFSAESEILLALHENRSVNPRIISLAPVWDQVVSPESTRLPGSTNIDLAASGHFGPLRDESLWVQVHQQIHSLARRPV